MLAKDYKPILASKVSYNEGEYNSGEYLVETAGYLPLREQLNELKRAGVNLLAYRMARADIVNAVDKKTGEFLGFDDIEDYDDDTANVGMDEIDVMQLRKRYRNLMANREFTDFLSGNSQSVSSGETEKETSKQDVSAEKTE